MARPGCILCGLKHLAQAQILLDESMLGYPMHKWLAYGHMAEAESELLELQPLIANQIREERIKATEDDKYQPDVMTLMATLDSLLAAEKANIPVIFDASKTT